MKDDEGRMELSEVAWAHIDAERFDQRQTPSFVIVARSCLTSWAASWRLTRRTRCERRAILNPR